MDELHGKGNATAEELWHKIEVIDMQMNSETGLNGDCFNVWVPLAYATSTQFLQLLRPLSHYEERFRQKNEPLIADHIMKMSDPQAVADFDVLVDEFNSSLERLRAEEDYGTIAAFYQRANRLVRNKE